MLELVCFIRVLCYDSDTKDLDMYGGLSLALDESLHLFLRDRLSYIDVFVGAYRDIPSRIEFSWSLGINMSTTSLDFVLFELNAKTSTQSAASFWRPSTT